MTYQVYVDDSGTGGDSPVFVLAGCEAQALRWTAFTNEWHVALGTSPSIKYFKASECFSQRGEFAGWRREDCSQKAEKLASIIETYIERAFIFLVRTADFTKVFKGQIDSRYDNPYYLMARDLCEQLVMLYANERPNESLEIIFDDNAAVAKPINVLYASLQDLSFALNERILLSDVMPISPSFVDEKDSLPLQAADMIAWFFRRAFGQIVIPAVSGPAWDKLEHVPIHLFDTDDEFLEHHRARIIGELPEGKVYFHQLVQSRAVLDRTISDQNLKALRSGKEFPTLHSFTSKQLRKRRLVRSCSEIDIPHLHMRREKPCLGIPQ